MTPNEAIDIVLERARSFPLPATTIPNAEVDAEAERIKAALSLVESLKQTGRRILHRKRGTTYTVLGDAAFQVSTGVAQNPRVRQVVDGDPVTIYRSEDDGALYVRFPDEMVDGRFKELT